MVDSTDFAAMPILNPYGNMKKRLNLQNQETWWYTLLHFQTSIKAANPKASDSS